jgi:hypothetical protein
VLLTDTGLLHWFTSPYVRRLVYDRRSETLDLETLSVLARLLHTRAHLSEVTYPDTMRPQVTFKVNSTASAHVGTRDACHGTPGMSSSHVFSLTVFGTSVLSARRWHLYIVGPCYGLHGYQLVIMIPGHDVGFGATVLAEHKFFSLHWHLLCVLSSSYNL